MSKVFYNWLNNRLDEYEINRERVLKAHATRWKNVIAKQNNGDLPTESEADGVTRFHAPYDGYVHVWVKGDEEFERTFLGGQYLPYDSPNEPMFGEASMSGDSILHVPVERAVKFMATPELKKAIDILDIRKGWNFKHLGEEVCNIHLNNCPNDIRSAIDKFIMGDIYKLRQLAAAEMEAERKARDLAHENAEAVKSGRQVIRGTILSMKMKEHRFGETLKMLVQDERGFRVWGSVPSRVDVARGDSIEFTATVEQSADSETFGFFKRPAKASVTTV